MALRYTSPCFSTISRKTPKSVTKAVMLPTRCHAQPMKTIKTFNFSSTDLSYLYSKQKIFPCIYTSPSHVFVLISTQICNFDQNFPKNRDPFSCTPSLKKIYEDKEIGIIGYKDKNGEVIYEGFDEGPRLPYEELEQIKNAREASTRAQLQKLLFDTFQTDHHCAKDAVFTSTKSEDEIINK